MKFYSTHFSIWSCLYACDYDRLVYKYRLHFIYYYINIIRWVQQATDSMQDSKKVKKDEP